MSVEVLTAEGYKLVRATASGPAAATSVAATTAANVDLTIAANPAKILAIEALKSISGLPSGVVLVGITYPDLATVRITVYNTTAAAVTIAAGSISAEILAKAA